MIKGIIAWSGVKILLGDSAKIQLVAKTKDIPILSGDVNQPIETVPVGIVAHTYFQNDAEGNVTNVARMNIIMKAGSKRNDALIQLLNDDALRVYVDIISGGTEDKEGSPATVTSIASVERVWLGSPDLIQ